MSKLELRIHPPIVLFGCALLVWLISDQALIAVDFSGLPATVIAAVFVLSGFSIAFSAVWKFHKADTTIEPTRPDETSALVTSGVFGFSRNPMYLALSLLLAGWIVFLGNPISLLIWIMFVAYITRFQIQPEEKVLLEKFGDVYRRYCDQVRRWI